MKLFGEFEAVKFVEENLILITRNEWLYYIYNPKYKYWHKYYNAGNTRITTKNYTDVFKVELVKAMKGKFPSDETDFLRLCHPEELWIDDIICLLSKDHETYMEDSEIYHTVHRLLLRSNILHRSYLSINELFHNGEKQQKNNKRVFKELKELSFNILGVDIFEKKIRIIDGNYGSSFFNISPVRVIDYSDTNTRNNVAKMNSATISIEEDDVSSYLMPFIHKHFDDELKANKMRVEYSWLDDNGNEQFSFIKGFEWYLTNNFFTFDSIKTILQEMSDTIEAYRIGKSTEHTEKIKTKNPELVIDFYNRFTYRMEYMMKIAEENGYNLISFMGP